MAKKELAVRILVDEKQINKALVTLDQDVLSREEINKRFFDREPFLFDVDLMEEEALAMTTAFVGLIEDDNQEREKVINKPNERKD